MNSSLDPISNAITVSIFVNYSRRYFKDFRIRHSFPAVKKIQRRDSWREIFLFPTIFRLVLVVFALGRILARMQSMNPPQ